MGGQFLVEIAKPCCVSYSIRARSKITSQNSRPDLGQIWPFRLSKTTVIAGYFEDFVPPRAGRNDQRWPEDGMRKWEVIFERALSSGQKRGSASMGAGMPREKNAIFPE